MRAKTTLLCETMALGVLAVATCTAQGQMSPGAPASGTQQTQPSTQTPPRTTDTMQNAASTGDSAGDMRDRMFLKDSAQGSMAEVKLAQLALQKSSNDEVKQFAQKMVDDHTMLIEKMKPFADKAGIKPPEKLPKDAQKEYDKLSGLSGPEFDKEYIAGMVKDHHKDMKKFDTELNVTQNEELKATVDAGSKVIAEHTKMIEALASKNNVASM